MQRNIPMKFAGYVAWILICKHCKFGEKIYYNSRDTKFFLVDYFFGAPCTLCSETRMHFIKCLSSTVKHIIYKYVNMTS